MLRLTLFLATSALLRGQTPDYGGPSILSRGGPASSTGEAANISFRPFLGVTAIYDTGLTAVTTNSSGDLQRVGTLGIQGSAGIYGYHNFRHSVLGLDYRGDYQHYPRYSFADGTNQMLTLGFSHKLSRRLTLNFNEAGGTYTRNYFFTGASGVIDPLALNLPANDLFDNRVIYGQTSGGLTYQLSARLSFNITGAGYLVRRRSSSLYGVSGYTSGADFAYRVTRFVTVGMDYNFNHFDFTKAFGASDIHSGGGFISARLSRSIELSVSAGAARAETLFLGAVAIDPAIAAITGQSSGIKAFYNVQYIPTGRVRLTRQWQRANLEFHASQDVTPGNGVYLTSRGLDVGGAFSYSGLRHWNIGANVSYARLGALAQNVGTYDGYQAGLGVTRDLSHGLQMILRMDERRFATNYAGLNRTASQVSLGFAWSPGDVPLKLW